MTTIRASHRESSAALRRLVAEANEWRIENPDVNPFQPAWEWVLQWYARVGSVFQLVGDQKLLEHWRDMEVQKGFFADPKKTGVPLFGERRRFVAGQAERLGVLVGDHVVLGESRASHLGVSSAIVNRSLEDLSRALEGFELCLSTVPDESNDDRQEAQNWIDAVRSVVDSSRELTSPFIRTCLLRLEGLAIRFGDVVSSGRERRAWHSVAAVVRALADV